jgi:hypothetical protein
VHSYNPNTQEAEEKDLKIEASQGYTVRHSWKDRFAGTPEGLECQDKELGACSPDMKVLQKFLSRETKGKAVLWDH